MHQDILPDCRTKGRGGLIRSVAGSWVPVYCANCGADGGLVPEEGTTFLFYLCNPCAETYGQIAGTMLMPDEIFFARLAEAQLAQYGHYLAPDEWARVGEDPAHPLQRLINERPT